MVSKLLVVAIIVLSVIIALLLVMALRKTPSLDVERWHRKLRVLRETAMPHARPPSDEQVVVDTSERNVRVLPSVERPAEERGHDGQQRGEKQREVQDPEGQARRGERQREEPEFGEEQPYGVDSEELQSEHGQSPEDPHGTSPDKA